MKRDYIQTRITTGRFNLPVSIFISALCWVGICFVLPDSPKEETTYALWNNIATLAIPNWVNKAICFLLYIIIGYVLIMINNTFGIIRTRASVQTSIYLLLIAACPTIHMLYPGDVATLMLILSLYMLFSTYQHPRPEAYMFNAFLFIGLGSIVFPQLTLFTPILLIGAFKFYALTLRSFCAALIGWAFPHLFLFGHAFFYGQMELFYQPFMELAAFSPIDFSGLESREIVTLAYCFVLYLVSSIHSLVQSYKDKIRTRVFLRFLILLTFCMFLFIALQPVQHANLLPLLLLGVSILASHMFVLTTNKISNIFFIGTGVSLILLLLFNVWMLL